MELLKYFLKGTNLELLKKTDEIKFVVSSREDFDWAIRAIRRHELDKRLRCNRKSS